MTYLSSTEGIEMDYIIIKDSTYHKRSYDILIDAQETKLYIIGGFHFHLQ